MRLRSNFCDDSMFLLAEAIHSIKRKDNARLKVLSPEKMALNAQISRDRKDRILRENQEQIEVINGHRSYHY